MADGGGESDLVLDTLKNTFPKADFSRKARHRGLSTPKLVSLSQPGICSPLPDQR